MIQISEKNRDSSNINGEMEIESIHRLDSIK